MRNAKCGMRSGIDLIPNFPFPDSHSALLILTRSRFLIGKVGNVAYLLS